MIYPHFLMFFQLRRGGARVVPPSQPEQDPQAVRPFAAAGQLPARSSDEMGGRRHGTTWSHNSGAASPVFSLIPLLVLQGQLRRFE
jgi:hypothetical protein